MKTRLFISTLSLVLFISITACDKEEDEMPMMDTLSLNLMNLPTLSSNEQYEGWVIVKGSPISTGTFTVGENGALSTSAFMVDPDQLMQATDFVLTIEPIPDNDPAPSSIKILGGSFSGNDANVNIAHAAALGADFSKTTGKYILATPTTTTTEDELSGVWFLDLSGGAPTKGLELPSLPSNWLYEGWAVIDGTPVSTGTFSAADMIDNGAPYSGSDASGPAFPGEDFVTAAPSDLSFPTDLSGATIVISIEPSPDNSTQPFAFKPLIGTVPTDATDHTTYDLVYEENTFPYGSVSR
ncbi:anti-sigma factor [Xanthovirga aplysinae]|uniref:anti-sigma factor n=1 Tax=Xanthovirga aplysinae TaxID=2529853 RepID=UPI0012BC788A|nr:anti-sigma factor [Xanthovirga aplysinae]MTI32157.1 anti-sigma factor [Xanthovirga aplysinae]